jgi:hypothetical protein
MTPTRDPVPDRSVVAGLLAARDGALGDAFLAGAIVHVDFFEEVRRNPGTVADISTRLGLDRRLTDVLCTLARAMGLVEPGELVQPSASAVECLTDAGATDLRPYFAVVAARPEAIELVEVLRTGKPAPFASTSGETTWLDGLADSSFAARFTAAMDARGRILAPPLAASLADLEVGSILDVAGGSGAYAAALVEGRPERRATVLDRAPVTEATRARLREAGLAERIDVAEGDMFAGLPNGHELHLFSHALHDWDERDVQALLGASHAALPAGGWIADHDAHLDADKAGPLDVARFSVFLAHATEGRCYSVGEIETWMRDAGFGEVTTRACGPGRSVVLGRKP